jgi:hypothetical protein
MGERDTGALMFRTPVATRYFSYLRGIGRTSLGPRSVRGATTAGGALNPLPVDSPTGQAADARALIRLSRSVFPIAVDVDFSALRSCEATAGG